MATLTLDSDRHQCCVLKSITEPTLCSAIWKSGDILTSLRTNIADGGVDAQVRRSFPHDPSGCLLVSSCWQYWAHEYKTISDGKLLAEINKRYAAELIAQGSSAAQPVRWIEIGEPCGPEKATWGHWKPSSLKLQEHDFPTSASFVDRAARVYRARLPNT